MLYELHAWEEHPEYPSTEIRRDDNEREIVDLCPEGCDKSQCWSSPPRFRKSVPTQRFGSSTEVKV